MLGKEFQRECWQLWMCASLCRLCTAMRLGVRDVVGTSVWSSRGYFCMLLCLVLYVSVFYYCMQTGR